MVGRSIGSKLVALGHDVKMGSRQAGNENAVAWAGEQGERAGEGSFADAAEFGETVFNCTAGGGSLDALEAAGAESLRGKLLLDVANPLDLSQGMPPTLLFCNTESLGERIQEAFPEACVVKTLNTMNCEVMVDPMKVPGEHLVFVCGNDEEAKRQATAILGEFGWPEERVMDLGDISAARGTEMYLAFWLRVYGQLGGQFNIAIEK